MLATALCVRRPLLLNPLFEVYEAVAANEEAKTCITEQITEVAKLLPPSAPELVPIIETATPSTTGLVVKLLEVIFNQPPRAGAPRIEAMAPLAKAVEALYERTGSAHVLVPVLGVLDKAAVVNRLAAIIDGLDDKAQVQTALGKVVAVGDRGKLSAEECVISILGLNRGDKDDVHIRKATVAMDACFAMKDSHKFDARVFTMIIARVTDDLERPLPKLFGRLLALSLMHFPTLKEYLCDQVFPKLLDRGVWSDNVTWKGVTHCVEKMWPKSVAVVARMPQSQLEELVVKQPSWRAGLIEHVRKQPMGSVPSYVFGVLGIAV